MGVFVLRDPGGGSALRDGDFLRVGWNAALFVESLTDTLTLTTIGPPVVEEYLHDEFGAVLVDELGNPLIVIEGSSGGDRMAMVAIQADTVTFADSTGQGSAYRVTASSALVLTTILVDTFGGGTNAYTHVGADTLLLVDALSSTVNLFTVPLVPPSTMPWGTSQRWNAWVEFLVDGDVRASSAEGDFTLLGGRVTEDITRAVTADVSLNIGLASSPSARHPLLPTKLGHLLDPNNHTHVRVFAGYEGDEVQLGLFDLASSPVTLDQAGATVSVTGMSLERTLQRAGFWTVEAFPATLPLDQTILTMVQQVMGPDVSYTIEANRTPLPAFSWQPGDDRLAKIEEMCQSCAAEFCFDRYGRLEMRNAPTAASWQATNVEWTLTDGAEAPVATLLSAVREFSDEDSYNGVIVEGSNLGAGDSTPPIYHAQWITNPASPLYFNPAFPSSARRGPRPKHIRLEWVTTLDQAKDVAISELAHWMSVVDAVTATAPANPKLRIGRFARLRSEALDLDDTFRIFRVVHDLSGGPLEALLHRYQQVT